MEQITEEEDGEDQVVGLKENAQIIETPCQCTGTSTTTISTEYSPEQDKLKEPLSAPF